MDMAHGTHEERLFAAHAASRERRTTAPRAFPEPCPWTDREAVTTPVTTPAATPGARVQAPCAGVLDGPILSGWSRWLPARCERPGPCAQPAFWGGRVLGLIVDRRTWPIGLDRLDARLSS